MEPSATFGRGHKHSSSLLGPKPRSHPLPELATLAPTSPSFAGRGDVSGLFWNLVSGESAFRNALRCAVHRLVSIPSILRSQSQSLPHLRSLLHWRIEELAIPVLQDTVADEYHPRTYGRDIRHRFRRSSPSRSMQSQRRMGEQGVVDETFCCKVGFLAEHSKPTTPLLFGDVVTRELYELIPLPSIEAPCDHPSWGTKKKDSQQEHSQRSDSRDQQVLATSSPFPTQLGEVEWSHQRHSGGGISTAAVSSVRNPDRTPSRSLLRSLRPPPASLGEVTLAAFFGIW